MNTSPFRAKLRSAFACVSSRSTSWAHWRAAVLGACAVAVGLAPARAVSTYTTPYAITTLAGASGGSGSEDGTGDAVRFYFPSDVAADSAGNLYVADTGNHTIRKITKTGVVSTLAGTAGQSGSRDGLGTYAQFNSPGGIAVGKSGLLYVADTGNHTIRSVSAAGMVTTVSGLAGTSGYQDGNLSSAHYSSPRGIAVDAAGNVFIADWGNAVVRKMIPAGTVSTFAGRAGFVGSTDGTGAVARFSKPYGLTIDKSGNLYLTDNSDDVVRKITAAGKVTTLAGKAGTLGATNGTGAAARFTGPTGLTVDKSGNVFVADAGNGLLRKITAKGVVTTFAGKSGLFGTVDGTSAAARFASLGGLTVDAAGNLYLADSAAHLVRKITAAAKVTTYAGTLVRNGSTDGKGAAARFYGPTAPVVDAAGNLYVADSGNNTIRKITPAGVVTTFAGKAGVAALPADGTGTAARFLSPNGLAIDAKGNLYVADSGAHTIRKITPAGKVTTLAGKAILGTDARGNPILVHGSADGKGSAARFYTPVGIVADKSGNVYVADTYNQTIRKITPAGVVTTLAGTAGVPGSADGTGKAARFNYPTGLVLDKSGNLIVADYFNDTLRKVTTKGVVTTLAGAAQSPGTTDGSAATARFYLPMSLAADTSGNLYVADYGNNTIRRIAADGTVSTLAGKAAKSGWLDGTGAAAGFNGPSGVVWTKSGLLYVTDTGNNTIRVGKAAKK